MRPKLQRDILRFARSRPRTNITTFSWAHAPGQILAQKFSPRPRTTPSRIPTSPCPWALHLTIPAVAPVLLRGSRGPSAQAPWPSTHQHIDLRAIGQRPAASQLQAEASRSACRDALLRGSWQKSRTPARSRRLVAHRSPPRHEDAATRNDFFPRPRLRSQQRDGRDAWARRMLGDSWSDGPGRAHFGGPPPNS